MDMKLGGSLVSNSYNARWHQHALYAKCLLCGFYDCHDSPRAFNVVLNLLNYRTL